MLNESFGADIIDVLACSLVQFIVPSKWIHRLQAVNVLDSLSHSILTFFCAKSRLTLLLHEESIESFGHLLKMGDKRLGVLAHSID